MRKAAIMPSWRNKPANREYFNKRYTPEQQQALRNAARSATQRLYCDVLERWRSCKTKSCRRHLRCTGDAAACFRGIRPEQIDNAVRAAVIAGGPRKIPPATHKEWVARRYLPDTL
jgi:hypothetical protein